MEGVLGLGNLLPTWKGTHGDSPRLTPNIQRRAPETGRLQPTMTLGESLLRGGMGISQQLSERQHISVCKLQNREDGFRVRRDPGTIAKL